MSQEQSDIYAQIEEYYRVNYDVMCRHVSFRVGGMYLAEDVVQQTFLECLKYSDSFKPERYILSTWIGLMLTQELKRFQRAEYLQGMSTEDVEYDEPSTELTGYEQNLLDQILEDVKEESGKQIIFLYFFREYKAREVAATLDIPVKTVRQTVWRFKNKVKEKYGTLSTDSS